MAKVCGQRERLADHIRPALQGLAVMPRVCDIAAAALDDAETHRTWRR
jgi:hypothetical protein